MAERWEEARVCFRRLAKEAPDNIRYLGRLGTTAARCGDAETARQISEQLRTIERRYLFGQQTEWRARIAAVLGDQEEAVRLLRQAESQGAAHHHSGLYLHPDIDLEALYGYEPYEELRRPRG
jgi:Flp pilus assembly protein TadD